MTAHVTTLFARGGATNYAKFRPTYPSALVARVLRDVPTNGDTLAIDVGCGTGQLTVALSDRVKRVIGIDVSAEQVAAASARPNVEYMVGSAHELPVKGEQIADVVTIAQTMHWLDPVITFAECRRVLKPGGVLAVIGYPLCRVTSNSEANEAVKRYHFETLRPYWHPNRWLLDDGYKFFDLSEHGFGDCEDLQFDEEREMTIDEFMAYKSTSSGRTTMIEETKQDPLPALRAQISAALGADVDKLTVQFPFICKLGVKQ